MMPKRHVLTRARFELIRHPTKNKNKKKILSVQCKHHCHSLTPNGVSARHETRVMVVVASRTARCRIAQLSVYDNFSGSKP